MKMAALGLVASLCLAGCTGGKVADPTMANTQSGPLTEESFRQAVGLPEVDLVPWSAIRYAEHTPPMEGELIDAIADPFSTEAEWAKPANNSARAAIAKQIDDWWDALPAQAEGTVARDQVGSRFSAVISARILRSRLTQLDDPAGALKQAGETLDLAWKAFETAPGTAKSDIMPSVVMAAEAMAELTTTGTDPKTLAELRKKLSVSLFDGLANSLPTDFGVVRIPVLVGQINKGVDTAQVARILDPLGEDGDGGVAGHLKSIWSNPHLLDSNATVGASKAIVDRYRTPPKDFGDFESRYQMMEKRTVSSWGQNMAGIDPAEIDWEKAEVAATVKNPVGELLLAEIERQWLVALESAYILQMQFDAARIRFQKVAPSTDDPEPGDPLTAEPYIVDEKGNALRTSLSKADPKYIFVNQVVQHGVPLRR